MNTQKLINTDKISASLLKKLDDMDNYETLSVSVWFSDIDYDLAYAHTEQDLIANNARSLNISDDAIDLVFDNFDITEFDSQNDLLSLSKVYESVTTEEVQTVIEAKRNAVSNLYQEHNHTILAELFKNMTEASGARSTVYDSSLPSVLYVCKYAPNVDMLLTKEQILALAEFESVVEINYIGTDGTEEIILSDTNSETDEDYEPYDMTFFNVTGLATARDMWGLYGENMKVGMIEDNGHPGDSITSTGNIHRIYPNSNTGLSLHAGLVASIMVGTSTNESGTIIFEGAIPRADLYSASISGESGIKAAAEALLDEGVTAINCSFSYPTGDLYFNQYGDIAKWYDHISVQHNVHLILSSSNYGYLGVKHTNTSYNAIVVGACNNNGSILSDSSYISANSFMNKPDIVAPGVVSAPVWGSSGTSFAAPMVTSAVIQLSQANPVLMSNPTLMKAVLLGSAKITNAMVNESNIISGVNGTTSAISQVYGAGMLNVTRAYSSSVDNTYYKTGTLAPYASSVSFNKTISRASGKTIRVCLTWNKMNSISGNHINSIVTDRPLDNYMLTITTPSGVKYSSQNTYDNKQIISFVATESGLYKFDIDICGPGASGEIVRYSVGYSTQS